MRSSLRFMMRFSLALCLFWATLVQAFDHGTWDGLLERHVRPIRSSVATQVDYAGMTREHDLLKAGEKS